MKVDPKRLACGIGFCPFDWRWGFDPYFHHAARMLCVGPLRISWRGWR